MAQATLLICDGCEKNATSRRPVESFALVQVPAVLADNSEYDGHKIAPGSVVFAADAHDWDCIGRIITKQRTARRLGLNIEGIAALSDEIAKATSKSKKS